MTPYELGIEIEHALLVSVLGEQNDNGTLRDPPWGKMERAKGDPNGSVVACGFGAPIPLVGRWTRHCVAYSPETGRWMFTGRDGKGTSWLSWPDLFDYISRLEDEQL